MTRKNMSNKYKSVCARSILCPSKNSIFLATPPNTSQKRDETQQTCQVMFSDHLHLSNQEFVIAPWAIKLPHVCNWQHSPPTRVISIQINLSLSSCPVQFLSGSMQWQMGNIEEWQPARSIFSGPSTLFLLDRWWLPQNTAMQKHRCASLVVAHF